MRLNFNRLFVGCFGLLSGLLVASSVLAAAVAAPLPPDLPLILPDAVFADLSRITGGVTEQRLLDQGSIARVHLNDSRANLPPDTPVVFFRQGVRLNAKGQTLGVLAVPVGEGVSLRRSTEAHEIADPGEPGIAWVRISSVRLEIMRGDSLMTRDEATRWAAAPCPTGKSPLAAIPQSTLPNAEVLALATDNDLLSATLGFVVASGGCNAGFSTGQSVSLWRTPVVNYGRKLDKAVDSGKYNSASVFEDNPAISETQTPGYRIGQGIVIAAYPETAIIQIRTTTHPIEVGDHVRHLPAR